MARRRKAGAAEDLMDVVALLPWWGGLLLAFISYWLLSGYAARPLPVAGDVQQIGAMATAAIWRGLATAGQYVLPMICIAGACVSAIRRHKRSTLLEDVSASTSADALNGMSWQQFEQLVGEGFRRRGYTVRETGGGGADGGVDLVLLKAGEKHFVQCKQWKAFKVGVSTVRELYGVMAAGGAAGGFVVTSGRFTQEATAFANGRNIRLIDGPALMQLLKDVRSSAPLRTGSRVTPAARSSSVPVVPAADDVSADDALRATALPESADPSCPLDVANRWCGVSPSAALVQERRSGAVRTT